MEEEAEQLLNKEDRKGKRVRAKKKLLPNKASHEELKMSLATLTPLIILVMVNLVNCHVPVVIWHGMGDNCCHDFSMGYIKHLLEEHLPGVYVRSLMVRIISQFFASIQLFSTCFIINL